MYKAVGRSEETWDDNYVECRPMKITEQYSDLMTTSWLDAKEELDQYQALDNVTEEEKCRLLCKVLTVRQVHMF